MGGVSRSSTGTRGTPPVHGPAPAAQGGPPGGPGMQLTLSDQPSPGTEFQIEILEFDEDDFLIEEQQVDSPELDIAQLIREDEEVGPRRAA